MMTRVPTQRRKRILGHTRDYIARLGTRQEIQSGVRDADKPKERLEHTGRLDVDFLADNAALVTIYTAAGPRDLGQVLAELVGLEKEEGYWPAMTLDVRLTLEVLKPPPSVADQFLDG
jgi:hypothetical protein